ncbi:hypothetical protein RR46_03699 [Papilio xuthus]|uniref:Uncharacterized protein n=1 Tax=Papilio xuthus TaxID=66420 RepID=A0A194PYY7_PAPXU|nr:hypothetical protein RR46_03699 [Papilio xuthus]
MQAGGGWFVPWTMGMHKFAVALPMGGVVPFVPPLLAALPPAPPPLRLLAPPPLQHQAQIGRKVRTSNRLNAPRDYYTSSSSALNAQWKGY